MLTKSIKLLGATAFVAVALSVHAQVDVTQPGDPVTASSSNSPGSEGVANAIDNGPAKYLNFDGANNANITGFVVTPAVGLTRVVGMSILSANDAPERDPKIVALQGSNADVAPAWDDAEAWTDIATLTFASWVDTFPGDDRFQVQTESFANNQPYLHYRWAVVETQSANGCCMQVGDVELLGAVVPQDVTQPGDAATASSSNSPGSEGVANAIDNGPAKYLNFDGANNANVTGFVVTPAVGRTLVSGISIESANDAPERDPKVVTLQGSNADAAPAFDDAAAWSDIVTLGAIPAWTVLFPGDDRFKVQTFLFDNYVPYKHYRWAVVETQTANGCCMQVAEVELLGTSAPVDVTQPGDLATASSSNSPGSEGVANAIDNGPAKYLNFDGANNGATGLVVTPGVGETTVIGMTIQSANDAPERDPRIVTLKGSNADVAPAYDDAAAWSDIVTIDNIQAWTDLFPGDDRFQTQEFYFANGTAYKHYRWEVVETQSSNGCCMQVAEIELLAVQAKADCTQARFIRRPANVPVLDGETATFQIRVNGPWPLQWYRNGSPIPGATKDVLVTGAITAANTDDEYTVEIVGCETSDPVKAVIFTPSATKSIGLSWEGQGANGTPTAILPTEIAGVHLQAYWNNMADATATGVALVDSDNTASTVTATFISSGEWGSGTGDVTPRQRLLNGLIYDNPGGEPGSVTFNGVPAGSHSIIAYTVGVPLQFQDQDYTVVGSTTKSIYTKQMNADQYNPNPVYVRGTSPDPNIRTLANYVRFDQISPAADGTIRLDWTTATTGFDRGVALNAIQLLIDPPYLGEPPTLVQSPEPTETLAGATVVLNSLATGDNLSYQWSKGGIDLANGGRISGATGPNLTIRSFGAADEGYYSVSVLNDAGSVVSERALVHIVAGDRTLTGTLVSHFTFDGSAANTGSDATDGIVDEGAGGPAGFSAGKIGQAFFNELYGFVKVPNYTKFTDEGTVSMWINASAALPTYGTDAVFAINAEGDIGVAQPYEQFAFELSYDDSIIGFHLSATIGAGPNRVTVTDPATFPIDSWQHVAFTIDGGQMRLYHNGELVGVSNYLNPINSPALDFLAIGSRVIGTYPDILPDTSTATSSLTFEGQIDDLGIWTTAWPATVIESIYTQGNAGQNLTTASLPTLPEPPTEGPAMSATVEGGNLSISWDSATGALESSTDLINWTEVTGASNPYTATPDGSGTFYRVRVD